MFSTEYGYAKDNYLEFKDTGSKDRLKNHKRLFKFLIKWGLKVSDCTI